MCEESRCDNVFYMTWNTACVALNFPLYLKIMVCHILWLKWGSRYACAKFMPVEFFVLVYSVGSIFVASL